MPPKVKQRRTGPAGSREKDAPPPEAFTPERFERELKDLAAKAKEQTWSKRAWEQVGPYVRAATLLALMGIYSNVSQMALSPVYGSIPAAAHHQKVAVAACFVGWAGNLALSSLMRGRQLQLLPVAAAYVPVAQFYLGRLSGLLTAHWGPAVTEALTLFPIMVLSAACVATYLDGAEPLPGPKPPAWIGDALPGIGSWLFFKLVEAYSGRYLQAHAGETILHTRMGLEIVLAASYAAYAPSRLLMYAVPAALHTAFLNTHVATAVAFNALEASLRRDGWLLLDRRESLTGYISVIESLEQGFRVMRCDHSILGGEWVKFQDSRLAEPIYGVFVMLEAVRLVKRSTPVSDDKAKALVIGLGIGTTPAALVAHGIDTTVVEIDPVVHAFAQTYFQLPSNHTPVIADAVGYTAKLANETGGEMFDYIVHDVFTGGAEPIPLFTLEFLQGLNSLLKPDGVIAINYAGDFLLPTPKMVVATINEVFPSCRIFRESPRPSDEEIAKTGKDFTNMVIFCTKTDRELEFRKAGEADFLGTRSREAFLMPEHEVDPESFQLKKGEIKGRAVLWANDTQKLAEWHTKSALGHWEVMRIVLPAAVWESW